jgi:hypothetical protein
MTSDEKASFKHGLIPVWLHVTISMAGSIGGFLALSWESWYFIS